MDGQKINLRAKLLSLGLTQVQFAAYIGVHPQTVSTWIGKGRVPVVAVKVLELLEAFHTLWQTIWPPVMDRKTGRPRKAQPDVFENFKRR